MKVKIRSQEKCPVCNSKFILTYRGMYCPMHPKVSPNRYYLDWYYLGEQFKLFGFDSFKEVAIKASAIEEEIEGFKFKPNHYKGQRSTANKRFSFSVCAEKWLQSREKDKRKNRISPLYFGKLEQAVQMFTDYFGNEDIRQIKTYRIKDFYETLNDDLSLKTQKNYMSILQKFFKDMYEVNEIIDEIPRFPKIKPQDPTIKWISKQDQLRVLQEIPEHHKPIFLFMFNTGCRPSEARGLLWDDVDLENDVVIIRHAFSGNVHRKITKGKKERVLPMSKELKQMLQNHPKTLRSEFVFHTYYGKPYGMNRLRKVWNKACKKAGIKGINCYGGTRHSFVSQGLNKGKPKDLMGEWLGHGDRQTIEKYSHVNLEGMRKVLDE